MKLTKIERFLLFQSQISTLKKEIFFPVDFDKVERSTELFSGVERSTLEDEKRKSPDIFSSKSKSKSKNRRTHTV